MKKSIFAIATAVAAMFGLAACDGENPFGNINGGNDLLGHITLVTSNPQNGEQPYGEGDTLNFASAMCNINVTVEDSIAVDFGSLFVGTEANLLQGENANITYPMIGLNLRDTAETTYEVNCPVDQVSFFKTIDSTNWRSLLTENQPDLGNIVVLAASEHALYIGYAGTITITRFANMGSLVKGSFNNVKAAYVTEADIEALAIEDIETIDIEARFPHITLNGEISSRRADIQAIIEQLDEQAE